MPLKGEILVPFSPEALLSGVSRQLQPDEYLWYERSISFTADELARKAKGQRCILHFGAVDQQAVVYCNGREAVSHTGGYLPFEADITNEVSDEPMLLQVRVVYPRKTDLEAGRYVLHCPERYLAERLVRVGAGKLYPCDENHPGCRPRRRLH